MTPNHWGDLMMEAPGVGPAHRSDGQRTPTAVLWPHGSQFLPHNQIHVNIISLWNKARAFTDALDESSSRVLHHGEKHVFIRCKQHTVLVTQERQWQHQKWNNIGLWRASKLNIFSFNNGGSQTVVCIPPMVLGHPLVLEEEFGDLTLKRVY